ncbi:hypothetical protein [Amazonocrinis nigriterrae]|uniref:hypothetical protein n=1 Tax=Amazonocrinis nigriterrae TaxID=2840443 RepID=UPI001CED0CAC|nr:hypothetical protein [Amazonocrinis nigriterrae]
MAEQLPENPVDEFSMQCWTDDPASAERYQETDAEISAVGIGGGGRGVGEVGLEE